MTSPVLMQIEILLGSIGVTLSLFFGIILYVNRNKASANIFLFIYLMAFALRIGKSLFHNYFDLPPTLRTYILNALFCIGPSVWLVTKYMVNPILKIEKRDFLHYAIFVIMLPMCWFIPNNGSKIFGWFYNASIIHMFIYILYAFYWVRNNNLDDKFNRNDNTRVWLISFVVVNIVMIILYFLISQMIIPYYLGFSFSYSIFIVIFGAWAMKTPDLIKTPMEKYVSSGMSSHQSQLLLEKIKAILKNEKIFTDPNLSLSKLSTKVSSSPKEVSQAINQATNLNYSQYITQFRIEEAKKMLASPDFAHYKISAIAFDSGFSSISSFNAQFKKTTRTTAQAYRNQYL